MQKDDVTGLGDSLERVVGERKTHNASRVLKTHEVAPMCVAGAWAMATKEQEIKEIVGDRWRSQEDDGR